MRAHRPQPPARRRLLCVGARVCTRALRGCMEERAYATMYEGLAMLCHSALGRIIAPALPRRCCSPFGTAAAPAAAVHRRRGTSSSGITCEDMERGMSAKPVRKGVYSSRRAQLSREHGPATPFCSHAAGPLACREGLFECARLPRANYTPAASREVARPAA